MQRRQFLTTATILSATAPLTSTMAAESNYATLKSSEKFNMHFAPHAGMFRHHAGDDILDQISFAADQGFTAW
ncbi:MAG: xylose isomerase, partial [Bacteroidota bacterium]